MKTINSIYALLIALLSSGISIPVKEVETVTSMPVQPDRQLERERKRAMAHGLKEFDLGYGPVFAINYDVALAKSYKMEARKNLIKIFN
jgi:hypothetical protein